jgi:hypothetical protein
MFGGKGLSGDGCEGTGIHRIHKQTDEPAIVGIKEKRE